MKKLIIAVLAVVLAVVIAVSAVASISLSERFPFTSNLTVTTTNQSDSNLPEFDYNANITDSKVIVANLYYRVEPEFYSNQHKFYVDFQHQANTELDAITLKFESSQVAFAYFAGQQEAAYTYSRSGGPHTFTVTVTFDSALGSMWGSSTLEFILVTMNTDGGDFNLYVQTDISLHYMQPLQLTQLKAETYQNVNLHQPA